MKKTDTHAFVNQLLVCVLVTICFGGSIGLGTVWLRHQISLTAKANRELEMRIAALDRQITETSILVESEQNADLLRQRNTTWRLGLVQLDSGPSLIVHLHGEVGDAPQPVKVGARLDRAGQAVLIHYGVQRSYP